MNKFIFYFCLIIFPVSCVEDRPDIFGDVLVRIDPPPNSIPNFEVGIFPSEVLFNNEYTPDLAIKTAILNRGQTVLSNILPGTYVVAIISTPSTIPPRQVVQIVADEVALVDFDLNLLSNE